MRKLGNKGGAGLTNIIWLALFAVIVYHGFVFGEPYYRKLQFEDALYDIAETIFGQSDEAVIKYVGLTAAQNEIPLETKNIARTEDRTTITIEAWWDVPVKTFLIEKTLHYSVKVQRKFSR